MPQKIDGLTYPKTVAELLTNRDLTRLMMQAFPEPEVRHRLKFMIRPPTPDAVFSEYIAPQSRTPISLPRHITQNAADLVNNDEYEPRLWQGIFDLVEANCRTYLERDVFKQFFDENNCPQFKSYHGKRLVAAAEKKFGSADDVSVRLNINEMSALRGLMACMIKRDKKGTDALAKWIVSKAKLNAKPAEVVDAIKNRKGLTVTGAFKVDAKKLQLCGFDKPDAKVRNRVEDMVNAYMSGDKTTAKSIFQLVQKSEPRGSQIHNETIESLFKAFKRFKVVIG